MTKQDIIHHLVTKHQEFTHTISNLSDDDFLFSHNHKWSAGQQLDHIYRSVKPVAMALGLPKLLPRLLFGKANRASKTYEELVKKYHLKLDAGGKAGKQFIPKTIELNQKQQLIRDVSKLIEVLTKRIDSFSEKELDHYILPHPLLGKLTIKEMLFFTIYHVEHHHKAIATSVFKDAVDS